MVYLTCRHHFCASHRYFNPEFDSETNLRLFDATANPAGHGHNYYVEATVKGNIDQNGVVPFWRNFTRKFVKFIDDTLDHTFINENVPFFRNVIPTTENLAVFIFQELNKMLPENALYRVRVWEDPELYSDFYG